LKQTKGFCPGRTLCWPTLEHPNHSSNTNAHLIGYLLDRKACSAQANYFVAAGSKKSFRSSPAFTEENDPPEYVTP
jgi:hypothetical protein